MDQVVAFLHNLRRFSAIVWRRFGRDRCSRVAGALAYTTLLAVVPLSAVGFAVLSVFPVFKTWMTTVQDFIYGNFVPTAGDTVSQYLQQFATNAGRLTAWGLVFLFVTAVMLIATIEKAFNDIWHVRRQRTLARRITAYWAVITLGPMLMGLSLSTTSYIASLPLFSGVGGVRKVVLKLAPIAFEWAAFVLLYVTVPKAAVRIRYACIGAVVATVLFECAKLLFGTFVASAGSYRTIYGAVAVLPVFLIWIYVSWVVTLLGAEVTAAMPHWQAPPRPARVKPTAPESESARTRK
jgi:membrane protein